MTNSYNVRNTFLTVNAEICLTVMGFGHMWSYATPRKIIIERSVISVARVPRGISLFFSFNSLCHSHIISLLLFHFPYLVPVLLYGRYVIIEMSSCRCFDNPITPAFAQPVCNAVLYSPEILETVVVLIAVLRHAIFDDFSRFVISHSRKYCDQVRRVSHVRSRVRYTFLNLRQLVYPYFTFVHELRQ